MIKFPLRISYPANRPYAGKTIEKAGDRVIITYGAPPNCGSVWSFTAWRSKWSVKLRQALRKRN